LIPAAIVKWVNHFANWYNTMLSFLLIGVRRRASAVPFLFLAFAVSPG
jgi:hypothetical protein